MQMAVFLLNNCKFQGCGRAFPTLADLIHHIEDCHIGMYHTYWFDCQIMIEMRSFGRVMYCLHYFCGKMAYFRFLDQLLRPVWGTKFSVTQKSLKMAINQEQKSENI